MMIMMTDGFKIIYACARGLALAKRPNANASRDPQKKGETFTLFNSHFTFFFCFYFIRSSSLSARLSDLFICLWFQNYTLSSSFDGKNLFFVFCCCRWSEVWIHFGFFFYFYFWVKSRRWCIKQLLLILGSCLYCRRCGTGHCHSNSRFRLIIMIFSVVSFAFPAFIINNNFNRRRKLFQSPSYRHILDVEHRRVPYISWQWQANAFGAAK